MILTDAKKRRDQYIVEVALKYPSWSLRKIAEEVARVYGECSPTHAMHILRNNNIERKPNTGAL